MASTVLVIGAHSDIGIAIAREFASRGFSIQLAARRSEGLSEMASDISIRYGVSCTSAIFDVLQFESHESFWKNLQPSPAVVVYVAGYMPEQKEAEQNWQLTAQTIHTNFTAPVSLFNIMSRDMVARGGGTLVGISSVAGERGRGSNFIYGSTKAGFTAYLSGLRNRMFDYKVHVMTVLPGFVYTRMTEGMKLPAILTAKPEEVAKAIANGVESKTDVLYVKWFWRYIMMVIKAIPEFIFKKKKL